jgi:hypothetical protein
MLKRCMQLLLIKLEWTGTLQNTSISSKLLNTILVSHFIYIYYSPALACVRTHMPLSLYLSLTHTHTQTHTVHTDVLTYACTSVAMQNLNLYFTKNVCTVRGGYLCLTSQRSRTHTCNFSDLLNKVLVSHKDHFILALNQHVCDCCALFMTNQTELSAKR